jgi:hypothetical protein
MLLMSTSLNVVRDAAVLCDCLRPSAILNRMRFILTCGVPADTLVPVRQEQGILCSHRGLQHQKVKVLASSHPSSTQASLRWAVAEQVSSLVVEELELPSSVLLALACRLSLVLGLKW